MSWYRASGISALVFFAAYLAIILHGHMICADELTGILFLLVLGALISAVVCLVVGFVQTYRRSLRGDR